MGGSSFQPDFKSFAALQSEPAKGSLDPTPKPEPEKADQESDDEAPQGKEELTISMYQDPRDELDLQRHQRGGIGSKQVRD
jgi:hypothetical protein